MIQKRLCTFTVTQDNWILELAKLACKLRYDTETSRIPVLEIEHTKAQRAKNGSKSKFQLSSIDVVETQRQMKAVK